VSGSGRSVSPWGGALVTFGALVAAFAWTRDTRWFELYTTRLSCITDARETQGFALARWAGIAAGALLVGAAWPVARAAARLGPRALWRALGRCALAAVLALVACELLLRVVHPVAAPATVTNLPTADADEKLGWRYRPLEGHGVSRRQADHRVRGRRRRQPGAEHHGGPGPRRPHAPLRRRVDHGGDRPAVGGYVPGARGP
jgi:hypothetical protein